MGVHQLVTRSVTLTGEPRSVPSARAFVRRLLEECGRPEWVDAAVLAVSELVTNAVLHAHSDRIELSAAVEDEHVQVGVRDLSPTLPSQRSYDEDATTGRGLGLVAVLSVAHGVQSLGADGKVVWFRVGDQPEPDGGGVEDLLDRWDEPDDVGAPLCTPADPGVVHVQLRAMPATLWLAAREHHDALLRELVLLQGWPGGAAAGIGDLAAADAARTTIGAALDAAVQQAHDRGAATVPLPQDHPGVLPAVPQALDLVVPVARDQARSFAELQDVLDHGERLAAEGRLLVRGGLPEITAVRDWAAEQVIAQVAGSPPAPWPGADDERFTTDVDRHAVPAGWDRTKVDQADVGLIAVTEDNRICAVSAPLAEVLGWPVDELVGRRVVAIVPPRFREAHVAGFSRHLSTGHARALGVHLRLPVLTRAGQEVECAFLIESEPAPDGQVVYLAHITPVA
jgi:PAS domain S-box-containing protein